MTSVCLKLKDKTSIIGRHTLAAQIEMEGKKDI